MARFNNIDDQVVTPAVEQAPAMRVSDVKSHIKQNQSVRLLTGAYLQFNEVSLVVIAKAVAFGLKGYRNNKNRNPLTEARLQSKLQFIALGLENGAPFSATEINCLVGQLWEATDAANVHTANLYTEEERLAAQLLVWDLCRALIPEIVYADDEDETV